MTLEIGACEVLSEEECYRLLQTAVLGRIGATQGAVPAVLPVNFAMLGNQVVFRTAAGGSLLAAVDGRVVAFEVDHIDVMTHQGWSVLLVGWAHRVKEPEVLSEAEKLPLQPWAPGERNVIVRLFPRFVTGRRITRQATGDQLRALGAEDSGVDHRVGASHVGTGHDGTSGVDHDGVDRDRRVVLPLARPPTGPGRHPDQPAAHA